MRPEKTIAKMRREGTVIIVAFGDSLTSGWMVQKGYVDFFQENIETRYPKCDVRIINSGVPGSTALDGLSRVHSGVIDYGPDCVLVQFALNDAFSGYSVKDFERNMETMIARIYNATSAEIVVLTSVCLQNRRDNELVKPYYEALERMAVSRGHTIVRVHDHWQKSIGEGIPFSRLVLFDGVHPTTEGYRLMAEALLAAF